MKTLFIDLSSHLQSLAVISGAKTLAVLHFDAKTGEEGLMTVIGGLLQKANMKLAGIDRIAATVGPGGFMSLRVGIALANALSDSLGVPLGGIHLSDLWAARIHPHPLVTSLPISPDPFPQRGKGNDEEASEVRVLWIHSTKQNLLFVRGLGKGAGEWKEPTLEKIDDLKAMIQSETPFVGELIESQQKELPLLKRKESLASIEDILPKLLDGLLYEKKSLLPWYGRGA